MENLTLRLFDEKVWWCGDCERVEQRDDLRNMMAVIASGGWCRVYAECVLGQVYPSRGL